MTLTQQEYSILIAAAREAGDYERVDTLELQATIDREQAVQDVWFDRYDNDTLDLY
jgi:ferritin-like metal-binding protein YciE